MQPSLRQPSLLGLTNETLTANYLHNSALLEVMRWDSLSDQTTPAHAFRLIIDSIRLRLSTESSPSDYYFTRMMKESILPAVRKASALWCPTFACAD